MYLQKVISKKTIKKIFFGGGHKPKEQDPDPLVRDRGDPIGGSGSVQKYHGSGTLVLTLHWQSGASKYLARSRPLRI
jgi:hypothetical protein